MSGGCSYRSPLYETKSLLHWNLFKKEILPGKVVINVLNVIIAIPIGLIHTSTVSDSMSIWLKEIFTLVKHDERAKESKKPEWLSTCNTFFFSNARLITTGQ